MLPVLSSGLGLAPLNQMPGEAQSSFTASGKGMNTLASKASLVLSTSYSDANFRGVVDLMDDRGIKNTAKTRRRLRLDAQREVIERNGQVLDDFCSVAELKSIKLTINKLNEGYTETRSRVTIAHSEMETSITEASMLLEKRKVIEERRRLIQTLQARFILSEEEELALTSTAEPVDDSFFAALAKAKKISYECEVLLGFEKQTLATAIMENASKNIDFGHQKLYKWVQREFKNLDLENSQMNSTMRKALGILAARPSLFQNCLGFFAEARQRILSDNFLAALTGANSNETASATIKPIDMIAHDSLRYVGDMLAWIHSAAVGEKEALETLFGADGEELAPGRNDGHDADLWRIVPDEENEELNTLKALDNLVDKDISGAAHILRQRVEQVIQANEDTIIAYKLASLLKFHGVMLLKLLGPDCQLLSCIRDLEKEAMRQFRALLREHVAAARAESHNVSDDLAPPSFLEDFINQLEAILTTYNASMSTSSVERGSIDGILAEAMEPLIFDCDALAKTLPSLSQSIYLINYRSAITKCFSRSSATVQRGEQLQNTIKDEIALLTDSQLEFFQKGSGLFDIIKALKESENKSLDTITIDKLSAASVELDHFLPSAYIDALERLGQLQDSTLARDITDEAAKRFCVDFELLQEHIHSTGVGNISEMDDLEKIFPRTASEIRVLLS